jgi:isopentenyl-diphosphate delta-isomerase
MQDYVIVVNAADEELGQEEKLRAHRSPVLHRAFSVFVLDNHGALLLQRRAAGKYHSGGLWSNACCGHPRPGESVAQAARRRLREEMGIECALHPAGTVSYSLDVGGGLREDEFNHVFVGLFSGGADPDPAEVSDWRWIEPGMVRARASYDGTALTPWFGFVFDRVQIWLDDGPRGIPGPVVAAWQVRA